MPASTATPRRITARAGATPAAPGLSAPARSPARHDPLATTLARTVRARAPAHGGNGVAPGPLLQRHAGAETAEQLLNRTREGEAPDYARRLCDGPELPEGIAALRDTIADSAGSVVDVVRSELASRLVPRAQLLKPGALHEDYEPNLRDWASGSGRQAFDIDIPGINHFMAGLFDLIVQHVPGTEINEFDLFHGHVVLTERPRDLVILFHAKEYPAQDEPLIPLIDQGTVERGLASGVVRGDPGFRDDVETMTDRNFLWVLSTNTLWLLSDRERAGEKRDPDFATLLKTIGIEEFENFERIVGTVDESHFGTDLMNVNFFPNHIPGGAKEALFFTPIANLDAELANRAPTTWEDRQTQTLQQRLPQRGAPTAPAAGGSGATGLFGSTLSLLKYLWQIAARMGD